MRVISGDELRRGLPMTAAIDALERAFAREDPSLSVPLRSTLATPAGTLLSMPAAGDAGVGVKLVTW
jgi:ornithine cyclodeaminase/alanine dehydrogenase-like protein (mu-crystallin family)